MQLEVVGVKYRNTGEIYHYPTRGYRFQPGMFVIGETARGIEFGTIVSANKTVETTKLKLPGKETGLRNILRIATATDERIYAENKARERNALPLCEEAIRQRGLGMQLIKADYTFDCAKLTFYFSADGRVDFRELVRDLASLFRTRIELRQIGTRDEAKFLGGLGSCGRELCCKAYLGDFKSVTTKMAKVQGLSMNPTKISGCCGRLMCCLAAENESYRELNQTTPQVGSIVETDKGKGIVVKVNLLGGKLDVKTDSEENNIITVKKDEVKVLKHVGTVED